MTESPEKDREISRISALRDRAELAGNWTAFEKYEAQLEELDTQAE